VHYGVAATTGANELIRSLLADIDRKLMMAAFTPKADIRRRERNCGEWERSIMAGTSPATGLPDEFSKSGLRLLDCGKQPIASARAPEGPQLCGLLRAVVALDHAAAHAIQCAIG
jgi:hypothetical protein